MTSVERARKFIQGRGRAIALTIVPLAALTLTATQQANAALLLVFAPGTCVVTGNGSLSANSCTDTPIAGNLNGSNSLKMTGTGAETIGQGGPATLTFEMTGSASGFPSNALPLNWDFTVSDNNSNPVTGSYTLVYSFSNGNFVKPKEGALNFTGCGPSGGCASVIGADSIRPDGSVTNYDITLTVNANINVGDTLTVNIPQGSIDVNEQPSSAPEPTTWAMGATGLLALALSRFRRRKV